jgi:hypothetical protein
VRLDHLLSRVILKPLIDLFGIHSFIFFVLIKFDVQIGNSSLIVKMIFIALKETGTVAQMVEHPDEIGKIISSQKVLT